MFVHQYIGNLRQYRAISIDVGDQDDLRAGAKELHEILDTYGVANTSRYIRHSHKRGRRPVSELRYAFLQ